MAIQAFEITGASREGKAREEARAEHEEDMARQDREELEYQKRKKGEDDHYSPHREERDR